MTRPETRDWRPEANGPENQRDQKEDQRDQNTRRPESRDQRPERSQKPEDRCQFRDQSRDQHATPHSPATRLTPPTPLALSFPWHSPTHSPGTPLAFTHPTILHYFTLFLVWLPMESLGCSQITLGIPKHTQGSLGM